MEALAGYLLHRLTVLNPICKLFKRNSPKMKLKHPVLCLSDFVDVLIFDFVNLGL